MIDINKAKPFNISKILVWEAWLAVKSKQGAGGVDGVTIESFEKNLSRNLYKIWNRLCSGSYMPPAVKRVEIPKSDGRMRPLGIPTIEDRVAQTVVKRQLEPELEKRFHSSSYGYRPGKSAHAAIEQARINCWKHKWVIDLDIKGFFDNMDHELLLKAVDHVTDNPWVRLYVRRWLQAEIELPNGERQKPTKGTPQGGVVSPLLANLFLHYVHDKWIQENYPQNPFERYADDIVIHCRIKQQAEKILKAIQERFMACGLEVHPEKTKIVYCEMRGKRSTVFADQFDFLGYTFRRRGAVDKKGARFTGFLPAISKKARKAIVQEIRNWRLHRWTGATLEEIAAKVNAKVQGWLNYYGKFYASAMHFLWEVLDYRLMRWFMCQYKRYKRRRMQARKALEQVQAEKPKLFAHWQYALVHTKKVG